MPENNQILSVEGQLIGMPTAGPESFSQQQLDYLKRALGVDETVLWSDAAGAFTATLNESLFNFEKIKVFQKTEPYHIQEFYTSDLTSNTFTIGATYQAAANPIYCFSSRWSITNNGVNIESKGKGYGLVGTSDGFTFYQSNVYNGKITKIVGIHRISGGN